MPSGALTVGSLVINMSANTGQLKTDLKDATASYESAAQSIVDAWAGVAAETNNATFAGERMVAQLKEEIATFGMSRGELTQRKADLNGVGEEVRKLQTQLAYMTGAEAEFGATVKQSGALLRAHGEDVKAASGHVEELGFKTARSKTEILVLMHELSQGNVKRFGQSMMVLGEQTGAAGLLFSAAGIAAIGMGAAAIGASVAIEKGAAEQRAMNNALILSGNYAGQTSDSLNALAHAAVASGGSIGEAKKAVTQLAESGKFTGDQLASITGAVVAMEHATGASIEETIKQFEALAVQAQGHSARASTEISQATVKLDEQYHFLTLAVYDQITALEKEGDLKGASKIATDEFAAVTRQRAEEIIGNLGNVASAWHGIKEAIGGAIDYMGEWGKKSTATSEIARINLALSLNSKPTPGFETDQHNELVRQLAAAQAALNRENKIASSQAAETLAQSNAVQAAQRIDAMLLRAQTKEQGALTTALNEYHASLDRIRAGSTTEDIDPRLTDKAIKAGEAALTKLHSQAVQGNDDRAKTLQDAILLAQTALEREKSIYDSRDKMLALYHSKFGMSDADFYSGREAARAEYIASEAIAFAKESALIQGYKPKNAEEVAASKAKYDELVKQHLKFVDDMRNAGGEDNAGAAAAAKKIYDEQMTAITKSGDAEVKSLEAAIAKQKEHNAEIGKTAAEIELAKKVKDEEALADLQHEHDAIDALLNQADLQGILIGKDRDLYSARLAYLDNEIAKRKDLASLLATGATLEADAKAASEAAKSWKHTTNTIETDLENAILDGGGRGAKKLIRDMELGFERMVLQPILAPISGGIASIANPLGAQAQAGGVVGYVSIAQSAKAAYDAITNGFSTLSTSVADGVQAGMNATGLSSNLLTNGPAAQMAGTAAGYAGGIAAGKVIGSAISGQFGIGGHGSAVVNIGTAAGAIFGGPVGAAIGGAIGGLFNRAFGMGDEQVTGRSMTGTLSAGSFSGTNNENWHQDGGWFRSDKNGVHQQAVDPTASKALSDAYEQIKTASADFAKTLGIDATSIAGRSQALNIAVTTDAAANQKAVSDFFVGVGDTIAKELLPSLAQFSTQGEAASATLQRIAGDYAFIDTAFQSIGTTFGTVGVSSIAARERLVTLSGGLDALGKGTAFFQQNFLSEAERLAPVAEKTNKALADLGYAGLNTRDDFKNAVLGLTNSGALATEAGAKTYAGLMAVEEAFAQLHPVLAGATDSLRTAADIANERQGWQDQLDTLTMTQTQLLDKQRNALDAANRPLFDMVQAAQKLADTSSNMAKFRDAAQSLHDGLLTGSLSTLTPEQQYAELRRQYEKTKSAALGGDVTAQGNVAAALNSFLTASQKINGGDSQYAQDFAMGQQDSAAMAQWASGQVDSAQAQLAAMNMTNSILTNIAKGITNLPAAIAATPAVVMPAPVLNYVASGAVSMEAVATEVKALRTALSAFHADANKNTGNGIVANDKSNQANADAIVTGVTAAVNRVVSRNYKLADLLE